MLFCVPAVRDRQLCRRLADRHDLAAHDADRDRDLDLCRPSHPGEILLPLDHKAVEPRRQNRIAVGPGRCHSLTTNVLQTLLNMQVKLPN